MRISLIVLALVIASSFSQVAIAIDRMAQGFPELPRDARDVAERSLACQHFWGEVNGTGDEQDKRTALQLKQLRCSRIQHDLRQIRAKYRKSPTVLHALQEAALHEAA